MGPSVLVVATVATIQRIGTEVVLPFLCLIQDGTS